MGEHLQPHQLNYLEGREIQWTIGGVLDEGPQCIQIPVPPAYVDTFLRELSTEEPEDWTSHLRKSLNNIVKGLSDDRDKLAELREKETALEQELQHEEIQRGRRLEELKSRLMDTIQRQFPDASEKQRREFFRFVE